MVGFAGAGLVADSADPYYRWVAFYEPGSPAAGGSPLSSEKDFYLVAAWVLVVFYLFVIAYHPRTAVGLFLLPFALGLIGVATLVAEEQPSAGGGLQALGIVHGGSILLGTAAVRSASPRE